MTSLSAMSSVSAEVAQRVAPIDATPAGDPSNFAGRLASIRDAEERREHATEVAAQFVGMAFIQPILAELHEGRFAAPPFEPTALERRFSPMFDQALTDRIATAANFPLTKVVADRLLKDAERFMTPAPLAQSEEVRHG